MGTENKNKILSRLYPEVEVSGYTSVDGTIEFYGRINSLLKPDMHVLDYGAGRAEWYEDDQCEYRRRLRLINGKVRKVVGCDVDNAVLQNNSVNESVLIEPGKFLPFENENFDLIISDFTFEHIPDPSSIVSEFERILKKGGWICARTPNKYSYVSFLTRLIKNSYHRKLLKLAQPDRKEIDVFPTFFKLNSMKVIENYFGKEKFRNYTYFYEPEPAYYFQHKGIFLIMYVLNKFLPSFMKSNLFIFLQKK